MLRQVKSLHGNALHAVDGEIGSVDEILFDDEQWTVRFLVVVTGDWITGRRKVLIAPRSLRSLDWDRHVLNVNLTRSQVEASPGEETDEPVSRQLETEYHDHFGWPYYWNGMGMSGPLVGGGYPTVLEAEARIIPRSVADQRVRDSDSKRSRGDDHLRSTCEVTGYAIAAQDGHLGHVGDFIVDDETWRICYIAIDAGGWWNGKHVLAPADLIGQANWPESTLDVSLTREQIRSGPEWNPHEPITEAFEDELVAYYANQRLQASERVLAHAGTVSKST